MRLQDYASTELVRIDMAADSKEAALTQLVELLQRSGRIRDGENLMRELLKREQSQSTGIGSGIAMPHALTGDIENLTIAFGRTRAPIDYQSIDAQPVDLVFMFVGPKSNPSMYVKLLARVARLLQSDAFKSKLRAAGSADEVLEAFRAEDETGG